MSNRTHEHYNPESYWSDVARRTSKRPHGIIAGDDEPFYRYKRKKFLKQLQQINFTGKKVLEIGPGPGGNLTEIWKHNPKELAGADISQEMINYAQGHLPQEVKLSKINGTELPYSDQYYDTSLTVTVLQHNTDISALKNLIVSICRCTNGEIFLFERIEKSIKGTPLNMGRPVSYYSELMTQNGFELQKVNFLNVAASYHLAGATRKLLNMPSRKEAEPLSKISVLTQQLLLPFTKVIDPLFNTQRGLAQLRYSRIES